MLCVLAQLVAVLVVFDVVSLATPAGADASMSATFSFTGGAQSWTVPSGVTSITVDAQGAQGGGTYGGFGARAQATIAVTPGAVLQVNVGGTGQVGNGGFNGGGGSTMGIGLGSSNGGGGATDVRVGPYGLADRAVVAGGGGGAAVAGVSTVYGQGGSAGASVGQSGASGGTYGGGGGGTTTSGGAPGGDYAGPGGLGTGGQGGFQAGGGGGGSFGGGGGGGNSGGAGNGGGGGGSSAVVPSASAVVVTPGYRLGNGVVTLVWPPGATPPASSIGGVLFPFSGAHHLWRVPAGVSAVSVDVLGGQGDDAGRGGLGGRTQATVPVMPGQLLAVFVGGRGVGPQAGFNGGGYGGFQSGSPGAGGGASDIRVGGWRLQDRVVVAGGGGGSPWNASGPGGGGGGLSGGPGANGSGSWGGGGGGTQSAGGAAGSGDWSSPGGFGHGANGGFRAGAGGGGYYGGGSGASESYGGTAGAGGGGSGYADPTATGVVHTNGVRAGNGAIAIAMGSAGPLGGAVTAGELLGGFNPAMANCICWHIEHGAPIDSSTGNFFHTFEDLSLPGRGRPLQLSHTYNSAASTKDGPLGFGWTSTYAMSLVTDAGTGTVTVHQENGSQAAFVALPDGSYTPASPRIDATLQRPTPGGSFTFTRRAKEIFTFDPAGQLSAIEDLNGYDTTVARPNATTMVVTAYSDLARTVGRSLTFTLANGRITQVADSSTPVRTVQFQYDAAGDLKTVIDVAGGSTTFTYQSHRLVTMREPKFFGDTTTTPVPQFTNHYDGQGRVDWQSDQLGRTTSFDYAPAGEPAGTTKVTDPKLNVSVERYRDGILMSRTKGTGAQAATWTYLYDAATLGVTAISDPNGNMVSMTYDASGNRTAATDGLGRTTTFTYDGRNNLTSVTPPKTFGATAVTTTLSYDAGGNLTARSTPLLDGAGATVATQQTTYRYDDAAHPGDVTSVVDANNKVSSFVYDGFGNLTSTTAPATPENPAGNTTGFAYDPGTGWRTKEVSPKGKLAGADPVPFTTTFSHDRFGRVTTVTDPLGHVSGRVFDANHNLDSVTDANANTTTYVHDPANQLVETRRPDATILRDAYHPDGSHRSQTDGSGQARTYEYDSLGHLASATDALQRITRYSHDALGNLKTKTDAGPGCDVAPNCTTTHTYDAADQLKSVTYSDGTTPNVTNISYDADGQRTSMTDGTGTSSWAWDSLHRLTAHTNGAAKTVSYGYDLKDQQTSVTYPGGVGQVTRGFDAAGRLASVTDWQGRTTSFGYDANANRTTETGPATTGVVDTTTFDAADRLMGISDAKGASVFASFAYGRDAADRLTSVTPTGVGEANTAYGYSRLDQLTQVGQAGQGGGAGVYSAGRFHSLAVKADGSAWAWGYNAYGQLGNNTTTNAPSPIAVPGLATVAAVAAGAYHSVAAKADGTVWAWGSNTSGMLGNNTTTQSKVPVQSQGVAGVVSVKAGDAHSLALKADGTVWVWGDNTYGQLGNNNPAVTRSLVPVQVPGLSGISVIAAGANFNLAVGSDGSVWAWGQGSSGQVGNGGTAHVFSPFKIPGLANAITVSVGDAGASGGGYHALALAKDGAVWAWGANASGQLGDGTTVGRSVPVKVATTTGLSQVVAVAGGTSHSAVLTADGSVWTWGAGTLGQMGNGTITTPNKLPIKVPNLSGVAGLAVGGDRALVRKSDGILWGWGDNARGQLGDGTVATPKTTPAAVVGLGSIATPTYAYDPADNLTKATAGTTLAYDAANQLTTRADAGGTRTYTHDARGNRKTDAAPGGAVTTYGYDQANRMTSAGAVATYAYNGDGLRMSKTVSGAAKAFVWDVSSGLPQLLAEDDTYYVYGPGGLPLAQIKGSTVFYYHHDQLGSTRALTDGAGQVAATYTYDSYGQLAASVISPPYSGTLSNPLGYAGQFTDAETGFQYLRARYYDPATGQFLSRDPIEAETRSAYGYVGGNPLNGTDPSGLYWGEGVVEGAGNVASAGARGVGSGASWVVHHPSTSLKIAAAVLGAGALAAATGGASVTLLATITATSVETVGTAGTVLGLASTAASLAATTIDCTHSRDANCVFGIATSVGGGATNVLGRYAYLASNPVRQGAISIGSSALGFAMDLASFLKFCAT